jgi:hypothetical protein
MNRNHFKKNPNQDHLFDIASQINDVKLLSDTSAELLMINKLSESEYFTHKFMGEKISLVASVTEE